LFSERLALEVNAAALGLEVVNPPVVIGRSGVAHRFTFLASSGNRYYAFDLYDAATETEVLRSYIKAFDTGVVINVVCSQGKRDEMAQRLAAEYNMKILTEPEIPTFFKSMLLRRGPEAVGAERKLNATA
jgi:hypothetical protein